MIKYLKWYVIIMFKRKNHISLHKFTNINKKCINVLEKIIIHE